MTRFVIALAAGALMARAVYCWWPRVETPRESPPDNLVSMTRTARVFDQDDDGGDAA